MASTPYTTTDKVITYTAGQTVHGVSATDLVGFYGTDPIAQPTVTGSKGSNAALTSLIAKLVALGLIVDSTS